MADAVRISQCIAEVGYVSVFRVRVSQIIAEVGYLDIYGSASESVSVSASSSASASASGSASLSPSSSPSASPSPSPISMEVVWGHDTGVLEAEVRNFQGNWSGTGSVVNPGVADSEKLRLDTDQYMISEIVDTGTIDMEIKYNVYGSGDVVTLDYRHGATPVACESAGWANYTGEFASLGFVQARVTHT